MTIVLQNIEVDWRDRKVIWNLYNKQVAYVRIEDGLSTACTILAEGTLALYAAETWTLTQRDRRLEAFEMWI